ncbi:prepilin peptidase [Janthinobacterium sp. BJB412]|nr:prepilin peptidase [Janthinobacterium sp. BJB412]
MLNAIEVILLCLITQAAVTDLAVRKIPNVLVLSGLALALALHLLAGPAWAPATQWLAGALAGFFLFLPLYLMRGMAAGDVKLMAMVGAFTGPWAACYIALLACLFGGLMALGILVLSGRCREGLDNVWLMLKPRLMRLLGVPLCRVPLAPCASVGGMPYGVAIALGAFSFVALTHH